MVRKRKTPRPDNKPKEEEPSSRDSAGAGRGGPQPPEPSSRDSAGAGRGGPQPPSGVRQEDGAHYNPDLQQRGESGRDRGHRANPQQQGGSGRGYPAGGGASPSAPGTSRLPPPNLQQATQTPSQEASSSRSSGIPTDQQLKQINEPAISQAVVPASSKQITFPRRPGKGKFGSKIVVKANHFLAELADKEFYQYDVSITPEVSSRGFNRTVINELVRNNRATRLGGRLPAYDGRKSLYTAGSLPFTSEEFEITLVDGNDNAGAAARRRRTFKVVIKFAARTDLHQLDMFLRGEQVEAPQEALQILDIVLRQSPTNMYHPIGRSFFSPVGKSSIGDCLECWKGFYQSVRPTERGLSLNIDISATAFIEASPVVDFVIKLLRWNPRNAQRRMLTEIERATVNKYLRGVKVEVTHRGNKRRKYRVAALTPEPTRALSFPVDENRTILKTVIQYFQEAYNFVIQFRDWPCLQVGNQQRPIYLPMEVCKIVEGQRYSKKLIGEQKTQFLNATNQRPEVRESDIIETVDRNAYDLDPYAIEFGIEISKQLASVNARVLPAPLLQYYGNNEGSRCSPQTGQWNMKYKKVINGGRVSTWTCINFDGSIREDEIYNFCYELASMCVKSGMEFALEPVIRLSSARPNQVETALKALYNDAMNILRQQRHKELDLLIVILPENNGPLYGNVKRICETEIGLISQCCIVKPVLKYAKKIPQYLANVALKINVKVGGRNTVLVDAILRRLPLIRETPTIIFGADVTHPQPGDDSSPSIAAVVASQDWPQITNYAGLVCAQAHRQELIQDLYKLESDPQRGNVPGGMIRDLLISFQKATGVLPTRIIFYRDGVSEGQFSQVLFHELASIRKACASMQSGYLPPITFVVVQKRHHTRLFANDYLDPKLVDATGNILPGTVVDSEICHPSEFDFYLCSHAGIKGTSRPAHYHVLLDENKFSADGLQMLTNSLCYTYARCTRSVSIVPPAYYAHLAAARARFYVEPMTTENAPQPRAAAANEPRSTRAAAGGGVRPLPALKDNIKRVMFFC